ncbi:hypothetical protein DM02DRAFT_33609 [Periconia macrospinosa]|uniref:Uncharacterized protein n=1 Tax=Periconia macrospinosa TaxID=97972 RepID=A0A2V1CYK3_9PLEO|nr:hypothetical protein DM02DRAFT_33609 [Periconia macrospinosa]
MCIASGTEGRAARFCQDHVKTLTSQKVQFTKPLRNTSATAWNIPGTNPEIIFLFHLHARKRERYPVPTYVRFRPGTSWKKLL